MKLIRKGNNAVAVEFEIWIRVTMVSLAAFDISDQTLSQSESSTDITSFDDE